MPGADGLTPKSRKLLAIIRECGDWVNRADLAEAIEEVELSSYQVRLLQRLIDKELIEVRRHRTPTWVLTYEYRVKP